MGGGAVERVLLRGRAKVGTIRGRRNRTRPPRACRPASGDQNPHRSAALKNGSVTFMAPRKTRSLVKG